jgi:hypothetical protein
MKSPVKLRSLLSRVARLSLKAAVVFCIFTLLVFTALKLWGSKATMANYERIEIGMTEEEVEQIFGEPAHALMFSMEGGSSYADPSARFKMAKVWQCGNHSYRVLFPVAREELLHGVPLKAGRTVVEKEYRDGLTMSLQDWIWFKLRGLRPGAVPPTPANPIVFPAAPPTREP